MFVMKTEACAEKRARSDMLMILMVFLGKVQRNRTVSLAVNELLHFRVWAVLDFVRSTLGHDAAVAKHDHASRDAEGAGHVVRDHDCGHVAPMRQFQGEFIYHGGHDWVEP